MKIANQYLADYEKVLKEVKTFIRILNLIGSILFSATMINILRNSNFMSIFIALIINIVYYVVKLQLISYICKIDNITTNDNLDVMRLDNGYVTTNWCVGGYHTYDDSDISDSAVYTKYYLRFSDKAIGIDSYTFEKLLNLHKSCYKSLLMLEPELYERK